MKCKQSSGSKVCGKCSYDLLSQDFIEQVSIVEICKLGSSILWMKEFSKNTNKTYEEYSASIGCNGRVTVVTTGKSVEHLHISTAKDLYCKLVNTWYQYHYKYKECDSYVYVKERLQYIRSCQYISKMQTEAVFIVKYLEEVMVCNGHCNTIVSDKEVSTCKIHFADMKRVAKFNSDGLVNILKTILSTLKDLSSCNLTIDLDNTYVTCSATVVVYGTFIKCKSTIADMESIYVHYLISWCNTNPGKQTEINKIRSNISRLNSTITADNICDLCSDLLDTLQ